jgi:hypothetical protein
VETSATTLDPVVVASREEGNLDHVWTASGDQLDGALEHDDVGHGQLTDSVRSPRNALCGFWGICTAEATIPDPWTSMLSFIIVMDDMKSQPWCYPGSFHRGNGDCATWPG